MKIIVRAVSFQIILLFQLGCADEKKTAHEIETKIELETETKVTTKSSCPKFIEDNKQNNLKISVFLDLSDRIESEN